MKFKEIRKTLQPQWKGYSVQYMLEGRKSKRSQVKRLIGIRRARDRQTRRSGQIDTVLIYALLRTNNGKEMANHKEANGNDVY